MTSSYNQGVVEILEEVGRDLQLVSQLSGSSFNIKNTYDGFNLKIGERILAVAGVLIGFVFPPLGIAIGAIGAVLGWLGGFFKSDEDKRREAFKKIEKALKSQVDRDFGKQITIDLNPNYPVSTNLLDPKYQEGIEKMLQERVFITQSKKTKLSNIYN